MKSIPRKRADRKMLVWYIVTPCLCLLETSSWLTTIGHEKPLIIAVEACQEDASVFSMFENSCSMLFEDRTTSVRRKF